MIWELREVPHQDGTLYPCALTAYVSLQLCEQEAFIPSLDVVDIPSHLTKPGHSGILPQYFKADAPPVYVPVPA